MQIQIDAGNTTDLTWLRIGRFELALNKNPECVPEERKEVREMMWETEIAWRLGHSRSLHFTKRLLRPQALGANTDA
ncbi:hypothetical protein [Litoreibacter albidus]|uniref:hypothetical protein n=1 Tax=Litoreibacter albidus TaxID=670155 RepID=UPI003736F632